MINYQNTPEQITEEIISYYHGFSLLDYEEATILAIREVNNLLNLIPENIHNSSKEWILNPTYTTLKSVLEILNQKIK